MIGLKRTNGAKPLASHHDHRLVLGRQCPERKKVQDDLLSISPSASYDSLDGESPPPTPVLTPPSCVRQIPKFLEVPLEKPTQKAWDLWQLLIVGALFVVSVMYANRPVVSPVVQSHTALAIIPSKALTTVGKPVFRELLCYDSFDWAPTMACLPDSERSAQRQQQLRAMEALDIYSWVVSRHFVMQS